MPPARPSLTRARHSEDRPITPRPGSARHPRQVGGAEFALESTPHHADRPRTSGPPIAGHKSGEVPLAPKGMTSVARPGTQLPATRTLSMLPTYTFPAETSSSAGARARVPQAHQRPGDCDRGPCPPRRTSAGRNTGVSSGVSSYRQQRAGPRKAREAQATQGGGGGTAGLSQRGYGLMLHATCYMLHATRYKLHASCYMLHSSCYMLHATGYMLLATCYWLPATGY